MTEFGWDDRPARAAIARIRGTRAADDGTFAAAVWSCLVEPGDAVAGALIGGMGATGALRALLTDVWDADAVAAHEITAAQLRAAIARWRPRLASAQIVFALETAAAAGIRLLTPQDDGWPVALCDLGPHAPVCLWVRGDPELMAGLDPAIAVVGARAATGYGEHIAAEFAAELAGRGVAIVSGAAYGIDGAAHRAAISAGGTTVALLAGGVDRPYPAGHTDLLARIAATGAVASEVPCGFAPTRWRFLQRNRLIAALGQATVVVEAGWRSGSLNTAGHAAALGRPLGAVPGPVTSGSSAGCHRLLREYDARCVTTAAEAAELVGWDAPRDDPRSNGDPLDGACTRVGDALSIRSWRTVDDIARRCGMAPADVSAALGLMMLEGAVHTDGSAWRRAPVSTQG